MSGGELSGGRSRTVGVNDGKSLSFAESVGEASCLREARPQARSRMPRPVGLGIRRCVEFDSRITCSWQVPQSTRKFTRHRPRAGDTVGEAIPCALIDLPDTPAMNSEFTCWDPPANTNGSSPEDPAPLRKAAVDAVGIGRSWQASRNEVAANDTQPTAGGAALSYGRSPCSYAQVSKLSPETRGRNIPVSSKSSTTVAVRSRFR